MRLVAVQTTRSGQPVLARLRQQPHTEQEIAALAASHLARSAIVVSNGLWWFRPTILIGAAHERHVTSGARPA